MRYFNLTVLCFMAFAQAAVARQLGSDAAVCGTHAKAELATAAVRLSAQKGLIWLLDNPKEVQGSLSVLWIMREINEKYCHNPDLDSYIRGNNPGYQNSQGLERLFQRLLDGKPATSYRAEILFEKRSDRIWTLLPMALYCDVRPLSKEAETDIYDIASSTGYILTHHLLAMMFMEKVGCKNRKSDLDFRERLLKTANKIEQEQAYPAELDIFAERTALLEAVGYPELVKREWIQNIVARQSASGAWGSTKPVGVIPHTTSLAVWALIQYLNECPL